MRAWEIALAALFLALCLIGGLYLARSSANNGFPIGVPSIGIPGSGKPVIGLVRFEGEIDFESANNLITLLEAARGDERVRGVVLELLSPGGFATSSESIYYTMLTLRQQKPLVVVIDGLAASGGYYMAAAGNRIFASSSAYVGNVGTRGGRPSDPAIAPEELSSGPYKLEGGSRFDQIHQLELVAQAFVQNVVSQRAASPVNPLKLTAEELGEARIYLGSEALALGLIDAQGGRADGIKAAAELAGLADFEVVDLPLFLNLMPRPQQSQDLQQALQALVDQAPPGAIYMLDSRIRLPSSDQGSLLGNFPSKHSGDAILAGPQSLVPSSFAGFLLPATPTGLTP
jgi:protease-4